ncbi:GNAT family N-acetyltransferase [Solirubrum puertoriconensis]|uniref:N-acetyltransferase domain-containing protein n=1 Tax=Solirubrum puertoriconensis TaxID=1751427 RepID=A0A9X0HKI6_SOLP1|nr:GNAT family N-acetyltransferase [Solirubrum puertoriconensis]KUG07634.1 hypothetical protein ASU33_14990 [Solirubrum puertoriconensis]
MPFTLDLLTSRTVLECNSATLADAMNRSFEQYFVPMHFDAGSFERRFRSEHLDPEASRLWFSGDELVGVVYIARRGWTSRVAAMGLVVEARGQGLGKHMLQTAIDEATARGDKSMLLEVFTPNEPAIRLYERLGFAKARTLTSFRRMPDNGAIGTEQLVEVDPLQVARLVAQQGDANLPWMFAAESLPGLATPHRAYHLGEQVYAIVRPDAERTVLVSLLVRQEARRQGWALRMLRAVEAQFPQKPLVAPLVAEGALHNTLTAAGWEALPLTLFEMERLFN